MRSTDSLFTLVAPALLVWLVVVFVKRGLFRQFPFFFAYIISVIGVSALRWSVIGNYPRFFKVFWATEGLYALMIILALNEVFRNIFIEFYEIWWWFRLVFPGSVAILAAVKATDALHHPTAQSPLVVAAILSFGLTVSWVQAALFGLICLLVWLVGDWEYYPVGIALGFAISALGSWAAYDAISIFGTKFNIVAKYGPPLAYFLAVLIWLFTFVRSPRPDKWEAWSKTITPEQMLAEVREYIKILKGFLKRSP